MQEGRNVEIYNSFEIDYKIVDGKIQMNMDYLNVKQEQCKELAAVDTSVDTFLVFVVEVLATFDISR